VSRARKSALSTQGSERARKTAASILQVMAGLRTPTEASQALGVSMNRYYQLETRGLLGMLKAVEPLPRGRRMRPDQELERLQHEKERAEREAARNLALLRGTQKALGLAPVKAVARDSKESTGRRARRPRMRAKALIAELAAEPAQVPAMAVAQGGPTP